MRKWIAIAMLTFGAVTISGTAEAGKKEKKSKDKGGFEPIEIQMTEVEAIDSLFKKAATPIDKINKANQALEDGRKNLNAALGLSEDGPLSDAITELATKGGPAIKMAMDGKTPKLNVDPSAGDDVKKGVDALNGLLKDTSAAAKELASVAKDFPPLIEEAKGFANPAKLKEVAVGMPPTKIPKTLGTIGKNVKALTKAPAAVKSLTETSTKLVTDVTGAFKE